MIFYIEIEKAVMCAEQKLNTVSIRAPSAQMKLEKKNLARTDRTVMSSIQARSTKL